MTKAASPGWGRGLRRCGTCRATSLARVKRSGVVGRLRVARAGRAARGGGGLLLGGAVGGRRRCRVFLLLRLDLSVGGAVAGGLVVGRLGRGDIGLGSARGARLIRRVARRGVAGRGGAVLATAGRGR